MSLYQRYELIEPLDGEGIWSFRARDAVTGSPVTVHLLVGKFNAYYDRVLQRIRNLPRSAASAILEIGTDRGIPYVVIMAPPFQGLVGWLREREGKGAQSEMGEFTQMFGKPSPGDATGAFGTSPSEPGEFTRMFESPQTAPAAKIPPPVVSAPQVQRPSVPVPEPAPVKPSAPLRSSRFRLPNIFARLRYRRRPSVTQARTVDRVHITVTAPANLLPGRAHELRFWAHLQEQTPGVLERALAAFGTLDPRRILRKTEGPFDIPRDTSLHIALSVEDIVVTDSEKIIRWTGEIGCAGFVLKVPADCAAGPKSATASIRVQGSELARIDFVLQVGRGRTRTQPLAAKLTRHRAAFASYASEDRDAVLARIQGIQKAAPYMKIFVDVLNLRSGEDWEKTLLDIIPSVDVFYLFWCRHAKQSEWVEREWRCAYRAKGPDFIDPIPLEPAASAPPPAELARKHFGEPILALLGDHAHGA